MYKQKFSQWETCTPIILTASFDLSKQWLNYKLRVNKWENLNAFKDTYKEKAPLNKTAALTKSTTMDIWVVGTPNQRFLK